MATLGIIGSGNIGTALAKLAVAAGIEVVLANSRGPESLRDKAEELGVRAGTVAEASGAGDWVVVTIPLGRYAELPAEPLAGKVVIDTMNYYPHRDGRIARLDSEAVTTAALLQEHLPESHTVKAFNNISAANIVTLARPSGSPDRSALPIAGNDADAKASATALIQALGFDVLDVGPLTESWRFETETPAYVTPYLNQASTPQQRAGGNADPGKPLPLDELRMLIADAHRPPVADRAF
ncbi:NADPH-dependent F420 reductase [Kribbella sp. NBC_00889]|uniref:NADPH-dependent F420 reductase n=1 Tax=Kribbella sp. NBC_00889 TaxID=2975974 RepID=UPI00386B0424|nr:NAD(P)-binding domain-containing protein [Kribbella sp. NBC_00889]